MLDSVESTALKPVIFDRIKEPNAWEKATSVIKDAELQMSGLGFPDIDQEITGNAYMELLYMIALADDRYHRIERINSLKPTDAFLNSFKSNRFLFNPGLRSWPVSGIVKGIYAYFRNDSKLDYIGYGIIIDATRNVMIIADCFGNIFPAQYYRLSLAYNIVLVRNWG